MNRTVDFNNPVAVAECLRDLRKEAGTGIKEVITREPTRSLDQNKRYWVAVVEPLSEWLTSTEGQLWTPEDTHEFLKASFLPMTEKVDPLTGEVLKLPMSTTQLRKSEFSILMAKGEALIEWLANAKEGNPDVIVQQGHADGQPHARPAAQVSALANRGGGVRHRVQPKVSHGEW
jgi:hypothetical protein